MASKNGTIGVTFQGKWPLTHLNGSFNRSITVKGGYYTFVRQPHPRFPDIMWVFLLAGLTQGKLIGTSESALANYTEHNSCGVRAEY